MPRQLRKPASVELHGRKIPYVLIRTVGRRSVHLVVDPDGGLQLRVPYHFPDREASGCFEAHAEWVLRQVAEHEALAQARTQLRDGERVPFLDETLELRLVHGRSGASRREQVLTLRHPGSSDSAVRELLERWYRREARRYFDARLRVLAPQLGVGQPTRLTVRGQRSRWGSCSSRGGISLNWRLMLLPSELVDYVVVHELCHLVHLNHSPAFWDLVASALPRHAALRRELQRWSRQMPL